uniref:ASPSCR1 tether for SLC2A4, UBX domain containing n=1 Tax=Leptobrachium leishanense TaxID=445787 RepID=A0A8C5QBN4_9ANUR
MLRGLQFRQNKILEDVCKKQNFSPKEYDLKFQRNVLDLSLQWRFANLPNNAKLEMVSCTQQRAGAESTKTRVAFQLEDGLRLQHEFVCSNSLWDVVSHFPETRPYLDRAASGHFPVCIYMRDEVTGEAALRQTSLQSLGITGGSVIVRFLMRTSTPPVPEVVSEEQKDPASEEPTVSKVKETPPAVAEQEEDKPADHKADQSPSDKLENPKPAPEPAVCDRSTEASSVDRKEQQNVKSSGATDELTPSCSGSSQSHPHTPPAPFIPFQGGGQRLGEASTSTLPHVPCVTAKEPFRSPGPSKPKKSKTEAEEEGTGCQSVSRESLVYHLDLEENANIKFQEPTDEFFEVTVDDIRRRFSQLKSERQKLEESPLLTKALRESQEKEKLERYPKVVLRVLFPDRYVLQGFFHVTETVGQVKEFVLHHLEDSPLPFYLFVTPPRTELKDDSQTLFQAGLYPAAVVHFGSQIKRDNYLCHDVLQSPVPPSEADLIVSREMPCVLGAPAAPVLENIPCAQAEEASRPPNDSTNTEESPAPHHQVQVPRDHGIVPKWLKLPGKK